MPEVKYLHEVLIFVDLVVNQNRAVQQFAHPRPFSDRATHAGKPSEQIHVVEQGVAKTRGSLAVVFGNVADDLGEIV